MGYIESTTLKKHTLCKHVVKRKVTKIIDGDTFKTDKPVRGSNFIRIANKDAPEKGQRGFTTAKNNLDKKIGGKTVNIDPVGKSYGRTVANVKKSGKKV